MNLKKLGRTLWIVAAVAMLAMVLQGCSSDDGSGISQDMYNALQAEKKAADDAAAAAAAAQAEAEAAAAAAQAKAEADAAAAAAAEQARMEAEAAAAAAEQARMEAAAQLKAEQDAEAAQRARVDAAAIQKSADDIVRAAVDVNEDGTVDPNDIGRKLLSATNTVAMYQGSGSVPGDGSDTDELREADGEMTLTATRTGSAVTFRATGDTDTDTDAAGLAAVPTVLFEDVEATAGDDMTSVMAEIDIPGGLTRHLFLMTDIQAATSQSFNAAKVAGTPELDGLDDVIIADVTSDQEYRYPILGDNGDPLDGLLATDVVTLALNQAIVIEGAYIPSKTGPEPYVQGGGRFEGSYAGTPGEYRCGAETARGCRFAENADGELQLKGQWQFVPAGDAVITDKDYLIYGAWLDKPDSQVGIGYSAGLSAGSELFTGANIAGLEGKAKYTGSAAGFYAERHVDSQGAASGTFTATAELTADFDFLKNGTTAGSSISGTITDFERSDDASTDWEVKLDALDLTATTDGGFVVTNPVTGDPDGATGDVDGDSGTTSGHASGVQWAGEWGVQLAGNGGAQVTQHPTGVVGTFGAQAGTPSLVAKDDSPDKGFVGVIGGFGARVTR